jgi:hypothetical protein
MFEKKELTNLEDYFLDFKERPNQGVYFYRVNGYNEEIKAFILKYYEAARLSGVIIEGKIPNPDEKNLAYYEEMMGMNFRLDEKFIFDALYKWLPRMNDYQRSNVTSSFYKMLDSMRQEGKNENMLKNAYIKCMCWLYYKFERIVNQLGENKIPKILYEGDISNYELKILSILSNAGCDIVLLQYHGDSNYQKLDAKNQISNSLVVRGATEFPKDFSVKSLRKEVEEQKNLQRLYGKLPRIANCTNAWASGKGLEDIKTSISLRGEDKRFYYNCFCRIYGVEDKLTYLNELYQFQLEIKNSGRLMVIVENEIPKPTPEEINSIPRQNYRNVEQMLQHLSQNIKDFLNIELQILLKKVFLDIMLEESKNLDGNINRLMNKAVYLLCWLRRYQSRLFIKWKMPEVSCFIHLGGCQNENEALFLKFLSRLPVDVLILVPDLNTSCCLDDSLLYEIHYNNSLKVAHFPRENASLHMGTTAYHAERELDTLMYQNSGIYRNQQYAKAVSVNLLTMYEEIAILWDQEVKYRPNFSVVDEVVNIPVIFSKVSGVKNGQVADYWADIKKLITEDTFVIKSAPFIRSTDFNPFKGRCVEFFKNGKLQKTRMKSHPGYPYGFLREDVQNHLLDCLEKLIDERLIKGTFENGMEYTIIATILHLDKEIIRLIQKFDFTKKNPKLIYIDTTEEVLSLEDSILVAFLNLMGFDIIFFVPTGYQIASKYFQKKLMEEHQIGEYVYDLSVPNLNTISLKTRSTWRDKIFKRGI